MKINRITRKEHYKIYKDGRKWVFIGLASFVLMDAAQAASGHTPLYFGQSIKASADTANQVVTISGDGTISGTTFASPEEALVGKYVDLERVNGVAKDPKDPKQNIDYYVKNVYVRIDQSTGKLVQAYIAGKTEVHIIAHGANNSVSLFMGSGTNYDFKTATSPYRRIREFYVGTTPFSNVSSWTGNGNEVPWGKTQADIEAVVVTAPNRKTQDQDNSFVLTDDMLKNAPAGADTILVSYQSNKNVNSATGTDQYYATPKVQVRTTSQITEEVNAAVQQANASKAAKTAQKAAITNAATKASSSIDNNKAFTSAQKAAAKQAVTDALKNAESTMDTRYSATDVDNDAASAEQAIQAAATPARTVPEQQSDAKQSLIETANSVKEQIDADKTLTTAEKTAQKQAVDKAVNQASEKISSDDNADDIQNDVTNAGDTIKNVYVPSSVPLEQQKANAINQATTDAANAKTTIDSDSTLTSAEKASRKQAIDQALADLNNDSATDAQSIADKQAAITNAITVGTTPGADLATQKAKAITDFKNNQQTDAKKNAIDADPALTTAEKTAQKQKIDDAIATLTNNLSTAKSADEIQSIADNTELINQINNAHQAGSETISERRANANARLEQLASDAKVKVDNDANLTDTEKVSQKQKIDNALTQAKTDISNGTAQEIEDTVTKASSTISNSYVAGKQLPDRKKDAEQAINDAVTSEKNTIASAPTTADDAIDQNGHLTASAKKLQEAALDKIAQDYQTKIASAADADTVNSIKEEAAGKLQAITEAKEDSRVTAAKQAQAAIDKVTQDPTMTTSQKAPIIDSFKKAYASYVEAIDKDTDTGKPSDDASAKFTSDLQYTNSNPSIADQQSAAKSQLENAVTAAKAKIDADSNLSDSDKAAQKQVIDNQANTALDGINQASTADGIQAAVSGGINTVNSLDKTSADKSLADKVQAAKNAINNNNNLTQAEKDSRNQAIDQAKATAQASINQASTPDAINAATNNSSDFSKALETAQDVSNVPTLDNQKTSASSDIDQAAQAAKNAVDQNSDLSASDKTAQKQAIDTVATTAKDNIQNAANADQMTSAKTNAVNTLSTLTGAKEDAHKALAKETQDAIDAIKASPVLSASQKTDRINDVNNASSKTSDKINSATSTDGVTSAAQASDLKDALNKATSTSDVPSITDQQSAAKSQLENAVTAAKAKIDADSNLSDSDKAAQKQVIDNQANTALDGINQASTADGIQTAVNTGVNTINALDKTSADKSLADKVQAAKNAINNNNNLTQAEKDSRNQAIDQAKATAQASINQASTPDGIQAATSGSSDFNKALETAQDVSNVPTLDNQKTSASSDIDQAAQAAKNAVDQNLDLSASDKAAQKQAIDTVADTAKENIQKATNADQMTSAKTNAVNTLSTLTGAKEDAYKALAKETQDAIDAIKASPLLSASQKTDRINDVNNASNQASDNINSATSTDGVTSAAQANDLKDALNKATSTSDVPSITDQQSAAKSQIENAVTAAKAKIDADSNLSDSDKVAQKQVIDNQAKSSLDGINQASTADGIQTAVNTGVNTINSLDKTSADKDLADKVQAAHNVINNNNNLTQAEKDARSQSLDQAKATAQASINQATSADAIQAATSGSSDFSKALETAQDVSNVPTLDNQKTSASSDIDQAAQAAKNAVDQNSDLSASDKAAQKQAIDTVATTAKDNIQKAANADQMTSAKTSAVNTLNGLGSAKQDAHKALAKETQDAIDAIKASPVLSASQKTDRINDVNNASNQASDKINSATSTDGVTSVAQASDLKDALNKATSTSDVPSITDQQSTAKSQIDAATAKAKDAIDNEASLSSAEKDAQKQALDKAAADAQNQIAAQTNADDIQKVTNDQAQALNDLLSQKLNAFGQLAADASKARDAVEANNALTSDQKAQANQDIQNALDKARLSLSSQTDKVAVEDPANQNDFHQSINDVQKQLETVPSLSDQEQSAITSLNNLADKVKGETTNTIQQAAIDKLLAQASQAIQVAPNADTVNNIVSATSTALNQLTGAKNDANADLAKQAADVQNSIDANDSLTDTEKQNRKDAVQKALDETSSVINQATDLPTIADAKNAQAFKDALQAAQNNTGVQSLADRKTAAKADIMTALAAAQDAVNKDTDLSDAAKTAQKQALEAVADKMTAGIDQEKNATAVDVAKTQGLPVFENLNKAKDAAQDALEKAFDDAKAAVSNNNALTDAEKQDRINQMTDAFNKAENANNTATDAGQVSTNDDTSNFQNTVKTNTDFSTVKTLTEQKATAASQINDALQKAIDSVNADSKLDKDAKDRQITILNGQAKEALQKLDGQTTAQGIVDFVPGVVPAFDKLNQAKTDARNKLEASADASKKAIDADNGLSDAEKQAQKDAIDTALQDAQKAVDNGVDVPTVQGIPQAPTVVKAIDKGHIAPTSTPTEQADTLNKQIADKAAKLKAQIDADNTLTADEKAKQKQAVDKLVADVKNQIAGLNNYQARLDVINKALDSFKLAHTEGKSLDVQKAEAKDKIKALANDLRNKVNADTSLSQAEKDAKLSAIEKAEQEALSKVDSANSADQIQTAISVADTDTQKGFETKIDKKSVALPSTGLLEQGQETGLAGLVGLVLGLFAFLGFKKKRRED
ncbi:DUF1542 domain-containing protein [Streptococcaceae bacterium ESL0729]|nr:DUF1542 domain-containing protein [Streptococcaceae bacterium ESL0729]